MRSNAKDNVDLPHLVRDMPLDERAIAALAAARELPQLTFQQYLDFLNSVTANLTLRTDINTASDEPFVL